MTFQLPSDIDLEKAIFGRRLPHGVHGISGPFPKHKIGLGIPITLQSAEIQYHRAASGETAGRWVFLSFTQISSDLIRLTFGHAPVMPWHNINEPEVRNLQSQLYEVERHGPEGILPDDRVETASRVFLYHFELVDCNDNNRFGGGLTPVQYINSLLAPLVQRSPISGVFIDDLAVLINAYIKHAGIEPKKRPLLIKEFVADAKERIAERCYCHVWLIDELCDLSNKYSRTTTEYHWGAAERRAFEEGLDSAICFDRECELVLLKCSKMPIGFGDQAEPIFIEFDPCIGNG